MKMTSQNRAKIVCTIGPATDSVAMIEALVRAGMDVARLNFSHGTHAERANTIATIREVAARCAQPIAILQDLAGPKVRTGGIAAESVQLEPGGRFTLTSRDVAGDAHEVSTTYRRLPDDVRAGDALLLSDGAIELRVTRVSDTDIVCEVVVGGVLSSGKGINLPERSLGVPFFTDKDKADLAFGLQHGVDYVGLSFVRTALEVEEARRLIRDAGCTTPLIAKSEKHEALRQLDAIIDAVDGVMVARGDLGVEIPIERVPRVQKEIIAKANEAGKPVITATQMLRSMVDNPRPTRAEVTDVANAILDGTDAVMLSEETAIGHFPVEAVRMMTKIAADVEPLVRFRDWPIASHSCQEAVARAACQMAQDVGAAAIITCTQSGSTTRHVAKHRPSQPILAMTPDETTCRQLVMVWGAVPMLMAPAESQEALEEQALDLARKTGLVASGDNVIITAGLPLHVSGTTNVIKVETV